MVDSRLHIKHPALASWSEGSSLPGLLAVIIQAFGKQCPVVPRLGAYLSPYGVTVSMVNEKIRGITHELVGETEREIAGLKHTLVMLERREEALNKGKMRFQEIAKQLKVRNQQLVVAVDTAKADITTQKRLTSPSTPIYEALHPVSPSECVTFHTITRAQALDDTLSLLELQLDRKPRIQYEDLRLFRIVAHDYFISSRKALKLVG
jgi:hypothetical protein